MTTKTSTDASAAEIIPESIAAVPTAEEDAVPSATEVTEALAGPARTLWIVERLLAAYDWPEIVATLERHQEANEGRASHLLLAPYELDPAGPTERPDDVEVADLVRLFLERLQGMPALGDLRLLEEVAG